MSKARWLLVLLVVGALAVALKFVASEPAPVETVQESKPPDLQLVAFDPWAAAAIVVEDETGVRLRLVRTAPPESRAATPAQDAAADELALAAWELAAPITAPADSLRVAEALLALSDLRAFRRLDTADEDIDAAAFGLDPPRLRLEIHLDAPDAGPIVLLIGEPTPVMVGDYPTYYVRLPGSDEVFAAGGPGLALADAAPQDLMPRASLENDAPADGDVHD